MALLYVTSDERGAGKTAFCVGLAHLLTMQGKRATIFKPMGNSDEDPDIAIYQALLSTEVDGWPIATAPARLSDDLLGQIKTAANSAAEDNDIVIVEGSSEISSADAGKLAEALDAKAVVVSRYSPERKASELRHWQDVFKGRMLGYVINGVTKYQGTESRSGLLEAMVGEGMNCLGALPEDRRLLGVSVDQLARHLGGEFLGDSGDKDCLVEYLMVGGWTLDSGEIYFGIHDNRAAIVRGGRPDMQMAALASAGTTSCIVLTDGVKPIEYVQYEAEQEEVPLVLVSEGTLETMDNLNTLMESSRFDHPSKLERFAQLMQAHLDVDAIASALDTT